MKHILIVETPDTIPDPEFLIEARCKGTLDEREEVAFREITLDDEAAKEYACINMGAYDFAFMKGYYWLKSILACMILFILTSCAVYPEPDFEVWQPRHTGTYVEMDTIIGTDTLYYWKKL